MISPDPTPRYYAYFNYLLATQRLLSILYPTHEDLVKSIVLSKGYQRLKGNPNSLSKLRVTQLLHSSWFTQIQLVGIIHHPELVPLNSPWSLVQAYYAIFSIIRAYFLSQERIIKDNHGSILSALAADLQIPHSRFPMPWNCLFSGDPRINLFTLNNAPAGTAITLINPLISPYTTDPWQHFGLFLKTTRKKQLESSIIGWKENKKRKRILTKERLNLLNGLRPTSYFDALYRIRKRSNYQDIDSFAFGVSPFSTNNDDVNKFHEAITFISDYTLLVFETLISKALHKAWLLDELYKFSFSTFVYPFRSTLLKHHSVLSQYI
jgi:hypothetical protein